MNRRTFIYIWSLVVLTSVLLVSSCHERQEVILPVDGDGITLIVNEGAPYATKAAGEETIYSSRVNGDESQRGVYLQVIEDVIRTELQDSEAEQLTKGTPYSENIIGSFHIDAFSTTDGSSYEEFFHKDLTSSDGTSVGTGYYWPLTTPETKISFFGYSRSQSTGTLAVTNYTFGEDASHSGTFTYTLPDATDDNSTHPDIVFAIAPNQSKPADGQIEVDFYHALSAITFSVGEIPTNFIVNSIKFTNIYSSGSCSYTYAQGGIIYEWEEDLSSKKDYTQTFNKEMFGQDANPSPSGSPVNTASQTFMMIPQTIGDDAEITISITIKDERNQETREYPFTKKLKDITPKWEAGKKYTFQISSPNEVQIVVSDEVNQNVKSNLVIRNNGLLPVYVRVAIIGYWINSSDEQIVADWDPEVDGDFNWGTSSNQEWGTSGVYWRKGSDGFYYYMKLLNKGEEISKESTTHKALFDTYTLTATPPKVGSELEMIISVQALHKDQMPSIWPTDMSTAAKSLNL